ncbi:MAG: MarR family transcriptional regulator [Candidatus Omnitrophica bacterium]|nr:MarR family transcriptional regulator [Candidatus Omnitrophota bacterium]MDD5310247.1 MarR family transcriptional regulator [Candidatus Omnitrophota bacterium]MDD5546175.1 MarR family transcriptional regulator [Candidatus Omnitrophota bacterium]
MATELDRLNNEAVLKLVRISEALVKAGDRFFSKYGVTTTQYDVLVILKYSEKRVTQSDLGGHRVVSRSNITGIIDRLEKLGLVKREGSADDRRVKYTAITQKGKDLIKKVEEKYFDILKQIAWFLGENDKRELANIIGRLEKGLRRTEDVLL